MSNAKHLAELAGVSSLDGSVTVTDAKGVTQVFDTAADAAEAWTARLHRLAWRRGAFFERLDAPAPLLEVPQVPQPPRVGGAMSAEEPTQGRKKKGSARRSRQRSTEDTSPSDDDA